VRKVSGKSRTRLRGKRGNELMKVQSSFADELRLDYSREKVSLTSRPAYTLVLTGCLFECHRSETPLRPRFRSGISSSTQERTRIKLPISQGNALPFVLHTLLLTP